MSDPEQERAAQRRLVALGYDAISDVYRDDDGSPQTTARYGPWIEEVIPMLPPGGRVLDLGCGAGVPTARILAERGFRVTGLDFSEVQIRRARGLVPRATFVRADMAGWDCAPASFDAIVSLYALIHVPLEDQRRLIPRMARWLVPGGYLLAIVGHTRWTGTEEYMGTTMFWDHADAATYLDWFRDGGFVPVWDRFEPEGDSGHQLMLLRATR